MAGRLGSLIWRAGRPLRRARRRLARRGRRRLKRLRAGPWLAAGSPRAERLAPARLALGFHRDGVERLLHALAHTGRPVRFVQVGACDGEVGDPLHYFVRRSGWTGILVEPVGYLFEQLVVNYAGCTGLVFERAALSRECGTDEFHYLRAGAGDDRLPELYKTVGSLSVENILKHEELIPDARERLASETVPILTLDALLRKHDVTRLELLVIDAEGHDFEVIEGLDLSRVRPELLVYERRHLSEGDDRSCRAALEAHGYRVVALRRDALAAAPEALVHPWLARAWRTLEESKER